MICTPMRGIATVLKQQVFMRPTEHGNIHNKAWKINPMIALRADEKYCIF